MPALEVNCSYTAIVALAPLKPHPQNPNTHPPRQLDLFAKILRHNGWRRPMIVSNRSGFIVTGHGARLAALQLGETTGPVDYQDFATADDERAHLNADNELARLAESSGDKLNELIASLSADFDRELAAIFAEKKKSPLRAILIHDNFHVVIDCDNEPHQLALLNRFISEGIKCRALVS